MADSAFGLEFTERLIARMQNSIRLAEITGDGGGAYRNFRSLADGSHAGTLRLWAGSEGSGVDRVIHFHLASPPVDTQLLFLFGHPETAVPHFHGQVVQFGPDACVYNADIIPRLDPVEHPGYFREVYEPITRSYWKATTDKTNVCAMAPANPAIAVYLSPWSIAAGRPTTRAELERVAPAMEAYLDQCIRLASGMAYPAPSPGDLRRRDHLHMKILHSDELDPRAWKGVYRIIGEEAGMQVKKILSDPLNQPAGPRSASTQEHKK